MSRRITFDCSVTDKDLALKALASLECNYQDQGNQIHITSGPLARAVINLETGQITSDSDWHRETELGNFRQAYSEADFRRQAARSGASIESRTVDNKGNVKIRCRMVA